MRQPRCPPEDASGDTVSSTSIASSSLPLRPGAERVRIKDASDPTKLRDSTRPLSSSPLSPPCGRTR